MLRRPLLSCALLLLLGCSKARSTGAGSNAGANAGGPSGFSASSSSLPASANSRGSAHDGALVGVLVVLGSSTSAGTGPSAPNNAWVPRYRAYLAQRFPSFTLTNLAVGGQTTYHIQPTGYAPPSSRPKPVEGKNITAALALGPDAIIVNLPSNDQAGDFSQAEQQANYERIAQLAARAQVKLWVTTPQPRNYAEQSRLRSLVQTRDFVLRRFTPRTLDFWSPFAEPSGTIKPGYDAGDGVHLNDAAHAILATTVIAAKLPETILAPP